MTKIQTVLPFLAAVLAALPAAGGPITFSSSGSDAASITGSVNDFRARLGSLNGNLPANFANGRREINWDAVPQTASSPNAFSGSFFNGGVAGRARGVVFSTPGTGFEVSANSGEGPVKFENQNATYPDLFTPFSAQKLFTPVGSNITDAAFFLPGDQTTSTTVHGFGAVFSDVDLAGTTSIELFDAADNSLGKFFAPAVSGNQTFSFLGVLFNDGTRVARVRITTGNTAVPGNESLPVSDVVAMDDFIYGEPGGAANVPEPGTVLLSAGALLLVLAARRR